jgi:hypothetical protein
MGEFGLFDAVKSLLKSPGHAEEFQRVKCGYGLFVKHIFSPD